MAQTSILPFFFAAAFIFVPSNAFACSLHLPANVRAGTEFTATWAGATIAQLPAQIQQHNSDGSIARIAGPRTVSGTFKARATNVLGLHTIIFTPKRGRPCTAIVNYTFEPASFTGFDIIISAGQSNASGRGLGPWTQSKPLAIDSSIFQVGRIGASDMKIVPIGYSSTNCAFSDGLQYWKKAENDCEEAHALTFARCWAETFMSPGRAVIIIPAAYGGTTINNWIDFAGALSPLYPDMIQRARAALRQPGDNRIVAIDWLQGESDVASATVGGETVDDYQAKLIRFFARARHDLNRPYAIPILAGTFVSEWFAGDPVNEPIKTSYAHAIANAGSASPPFDLIPMTGLTTDQAIGEIHTLHINAASQYTFGRRQCLSLGNLRPQ